MGLTAVTGVFSRYFVVGFFLPAYVSLVALWLSASRKFTPGALESHSQTAQLAILGGVAVVLALLLSGLSYPITRWAEGYPIVRLKRWPLLRLVPLAALALQRRSYKRLVGIRDNRARPDDERARAYAAADKLFPSDSQQLLPTRLGNAMRAYERHSNGRWGLDGVTIWPRIALLLNDGERELLADAETDLRVFLNAAVGAVGVGICLVIDEAVDSGGGFLPWFVRAIPFVAAYLLYRWAIGAAVRRGLVVRASIDVHRRELYGKLGIRDPISFSDERQINVALGQLLLYGRPSLSDDLSRVQPGDSRPGTTNGPAPAAPRESGRLETEVTT